MGPLALEPPAVLLLEGDAYLRAVLEDGLGAYGYRVVSASSCEEAERRLSEGVARVDAIVAAYEPGGPDWESLLRSFETRQRGVPRLHLREAGMPVPRRDGARSAETVLDKPARLDRLAAALVACLRAA